MPCYRPLNGWRAKDINPKTGRRPVVFNRAMGFADMPVQLPCGQCVGCRLERSRQWAVRCVYEAQLHERNSFVTLTYNDDNLPKDMSLDVTHFQKFMKRLRKRYGKGVRYFHCGEYGERNQRPHYHAIIFGVEFSDKVFFKNVNDIPLFTSEILSETWGLGFCTVGEVTFESAAYTARYVMKKVTGELAEDHYNGRAPEYITMSRDPSIGTGWLKKFKDDVYPHDYVIVRGVKMRPPKAFDKQLELDDPAIYRRIKGERVRNAKRHSDNNTSRRLRVREICTERRIGDFLPRNVE